MRILPRTGWFAGVLGLVAFLAMVSCARATAYDESNPCPRRVLRAVESSSTVEHTSVYIDVTLFDWSSATFDAQVNAVADRAVDRGGRLRVFAYAGSASGMHLLLDCPFTKPRVRNAEAAESRRRLVADAIRGTLQHRIDALRDGKGVDRSGSDPSAPFHSLSKQRCTVDECLAFVLTDGIKHRTPHAPVPSLTGWDVEVHGIGRLANSHAVPTATAMRIVAVIEQWLHRAGAESVLVTTDVYTGGRR